jgi:hypothetical protein
MIGGRRGVPGKSGRYVGLYYNIEAGLNDAKIRRFNLTFSQIL